MAKKVQIDLNKKLLLERQFFQVIRIILYKTANAAKLPFFTPVEFEQEFEDAIFDQYLRVFSVFSDDYRKTNKLGMSDIQDLMFRNDAMSQFADMAVEEAAIITKTSAAQFHSAQESATRKSGEEAFIKLGVTYAVLLDGIYRRALLGRNTVIACGNTQWAAEFSKRLEVDYLLGAKGITTKAQGVKTKRWDAVGDDLMRRWHSDADGQIVGIDELFIVKSEKLDFPRDRTHGASGANIHNCRCGVKYGISFDELSAAVFRLGTDDAPDALVSAAVKVADPVVVRRVETRLDRSIETAAGLGNTAAAAEFRILKLEFLDRKLDLDVGKVVANKSFKAIDAKLKAGLIKHNITISKSKPVPIKKRQPIGPKPTPIPRPPNVRPVDPEFDKRIAKILKEKDEEIDIAIKTAKDEVKFIFGRDIAKKGRGLGSVLERQVSSDVLPTRLERGVTKSTTDTMRKELSLLNGGRNGNNARKTVQMNFSNGTASYAEDRIRKVSTEIFDEGLVHPRLIQDKHKALSFKTTTPTQRANAGYKWENEITLNTRPDARVISHEIGHHIEYRNRSVQQRMVAFRDRRIREAKDRGETIINRTHPANVGGKSRAPGPKDEIMWEDKFFNPYVGKEYGSSGITEVMSMGVQSFFDPSTLSQILTKDPDHFYLIWATLRGY